MAQAHRWSLTPIPPPLKGKQSWPWVANMSSLPDAVSEGRPWPRITVITPSYNQAMYLEETIRSVLLQGYPDIEYFVLDGGSTDGSLDIIQRYQSWITHWESERDRGQSHAINKGIARATGQLIGWLNSDDVLLPNALFRVAEAFENFPEVDVVHGSVNYVDGQSDVMFYAPRRQPEFELETALLGSIYQPGTFWRREVTKVIGLLNEDLHYVMDYEYWLRMAMAGAVFCGLNNPPLANFRVTEYSKTGADQHMFAFETREMLRWFMAHPDFRHSDKYPSFTIWRQAQKARAGADLRIAQSFSHVSGRRVAALGWLLRSVWSYPPFLLIRRKQIAAIFARLAAGGRPC